MHAMINDMQKNSWVSGNGNGKGYVEILKSTRMGKTCE